MRLSRLLALLLVVVALGAFIYFFERHQTTTDLRRELQDKVFPGLEQDDIERVSLRNPAGRFELVRREGEWFLTAPVEDRADAGAVSGLGWSLATLTAERVLEREDLDLAAYGLHDPELEVTVWTSDGRERRLFLGEVMPLGHSRAATTDDGRVVLVGGAIAGDMQRDLAGWRSTELARVWEADVAAVSIRERGRAVQLVRSQGVWSLTAPISDIADRERAQGLLSDLSGAKIREFVDDPPPGGLGLDAPTVELTITRREGAPAIRMAFGLERTVDGELQVACKRGEQVLWVDGSAVKRLSGDPDQWRSPRLLPFESWAAESLEVESGGVSVALRRDGFRWLAGDVEVDGERVRDRLNALSRMMVRGFTPPSPRGEPLGRIVVVTSDDAALEARFVVMGDQMAAEVAGRSGTLLVDAEAVKVLFEDPLSLTSPLAPESSKEPGG